MSLPTQLKSARITGATAVSGWPTTLGQLEQALCDILGITIDVNVTSPIGARTKYASILDSSSIASTTSPTAFSKTFSIPGNTLQVGDTIRIWFACNINNTSGSTATFTFAPRIGGAALKSLTQVVTTGQTNVSEDACATYSVRSIGGSAVIAAGFFGIGGNVSSPIIGGGGGLTMTKDSTGALVVDVLLTMSVNNANTNAVLNALTVEILSANSTS